MDAEEILLEVQHLNVEVEDQTLIPDLSFSLGTGQYIELTGSNGVGKTTLLRHIAQVRRSPPQALVSRRSVTYVGQSLGFSLKLTPRENLRWYSRLSNSPTKDQLDGLEVVEEKLSLHGLLDVQLGSLSKGQQRRCALARLIQSDPNSIWVLDEPMTSLDESGQESVRKLISEHIELNNAAIVATHTSLNIPDTQSINLDMV